MHHKATTQQPSLTSFITERRGKTPVVRLMIENIPPTLANVWCRGVGKVCATAWYLAHPNGNYWSSRRAGRHRRGLPTSTRASVASEPGCSPATVGICMCGNAQREHSPLKSRLVSELDGKFVLSRLMSALDGKRKCFSKRGDQLVVALAYFILKQHNN